MEFRNHNNRDSNNEEVDENDDEADVESSYNNDEHDTGNHDGVPIVLEAFRASNV